MSAIYNFESGIAPYVSYSETFFPLIGTDFFGNPFKPITSQQVESGVKYAPPGYNILLTGAVFDIKQQNGRTADPLHPGFAIQTGEVRSRGFEIEAKASFARDFDLVVAYTNLDLLNTKSTTNNFLKVPAGVPAEQVAVWADYRVPVGPLAGLSVGGGVRHVGDTFGDEAAAAPATVGGARCSIEPLAHAGKAERREASRARRPAESATSTPAAGRKEHVMTSVPDGRATAVISVCTSCRAADDQGSPGDALLRALRAEHDQGSSPDIVIRPVQCLSVCKRPCTAALSGPGRYTYVFGDLEPGDGARALLDCARLFLAAEQGYLLWRERPEPLRRGIVARVPPAEWLTDDGHHPR